MRNYVNDRMATEAKISKTVLKDKKVRKLKANGYTILDVFYNGKVWVIEYE